MIGKAIPFAPHLWNHFQRLTAKMLLIETTRPLPATLHHQPSAPYPLGATAKSLTMNSIAYARGVAADFLAIAADWRHDAGVTIKHCPQEAAVIADEKRRARKNIAAARRMRLEAQAHGFRLP